MPALEIKGRLSQAANGKISLDVIDGRSCYIGATLCIFCNGSPESGIFVELLGRPLGRYWVARQDDAVVAQKRILRVLLNRPG